MKRSTLLMLVPAIVVAGCADDTSSMDGDSTGGEDTTAGVATTSVPMMTMDPMTADDTGPGDSGTTGGDGTGMTDAGMTDSGTDAGMTDTGGTDTGMTDTGMTDTGMTDTGGTDTGMTDSGTDTGGTDTGMTDSGTDTGMTDTGATSTTGAMCGDGVADAGENCDGDDLADNGCADVGMGFTAGALACDETCDFDTSACTNTPWPAAGQLVITEIMQNPSTLLDSDGEYFEVHNPTDTAYELGNCTLSGGSETDVVIDADLAVAPGDYVVLATDSDLDQGFVADYQWGQSEYGLSNGGDTIRITCDGTVVDEVTYDGGAVFPPVNGESMNLDAMALDATSNDDGNNWCESTTDFNSDLGTPGEPNETCPEPVVYPIDFCRLQFPDTVSELAGTNVDVFGRLFSAGLTDISGVNDPAPEVSGWVGYGPDGSDPAGAGWTWSEGGPNGAYGPASPGYEANNDEYVATFAVPNPPGDYDFAFRFSGDDEQTFTYCDGQAEGSSDGYQPANAGQLASLDPGTPPVVFFSEYAEGSSNNKALELYNADGADADMGTCELRFYFGGSTDAGTTISLAGITIADGDVLVVCEDNTDPKVFDGCDVLAGGSFYNGDDAVELLCGGTTLDVIGQIGFDPGSSWSENGVGTQNQTIRRDCSVTEGDADGSDAFDPSVEWSSFALDDFSGFGSHICP